ncbi:hypothetical protein H0H87_011466 [Tephrocybe sp. NHM501043]|nr:hypothetical protein H0H87_011466 [Tephrocybe sp. NHM501043]
MDCASQGGGTSAVIITKPQDIVACVKVPVGRNNVYVIFDSHVRPRHVDGSGFIINDTLEQAAEYLADILPLADPQAPDWYPVPGNQVQGHIVVPRRNYENSDDQRTYWFTMKYFELKAKCYDLNTKLQEYKNQSQANGRRLSGRLSKAAYERDQTYLPSESGRASNAPYDEESTSRDKAKRERTNRENDYDYAYTLRLDANPTPDSQRHREHSNREYPDRNHTSRPADTERGSDTRAYMEYSPAAQAKFEQELRDKEDLEKSDYAFALRVNANQTPDPQRHRENSKLHREYPDGNRTPRPRDIVRSPNDARLPKGNEAFSHVAQTQLEQELRDWETTRPHQPNPTPNHPQRQSEKHREYDWRTQDSDGDEVMAEGLYVQQAYDLQNELQDAPGQHQYTSRSGDKRRLSEAYHEYHGYQPPMSHGTGTPTARGDYHEEQRYAGHYGWQGRTRRP